MSSCILSESKVTKLLIQEFSLFKCKSKQYANLNEYELKRIFIISSYVIKINLVFLSNNNILKFGT